MMPCRWTGRTDSVDDDSRLRGDQQPGSCVPGCGLRHRQYQVPTTPLTDLYCIHSSDSLLPLPSLSCHSDCQLIQTAMICQPTGTDTEHIPPPDCSGGKCNKDTCPYDLSTFTGLYDFFLEKCAPTCL